VVTTFQYYLTQKVATINAGDWRYFMSEKYLKLFYEQLKEGSESLDDFGITGKYLFFHKNPKILAKVAKEEIIHNKFDVAKINNKLLGTSTEYVLCLYYTDDSRKNELAKKYQEKNDIHYRYWKSDEDTRKGKYSKEFLERTRASKDV